MHNPDICEGCHKPHAQCECEAKAAYWRGQVEKRKVPSDYVADLIQHKRWVAEYMQIVANELFRRAAVHDNSKFSPEEFEAYEEAFPGLQKYAYGTEEFKAELRKIEPAIQHHYRVNDHHPEFHTDGIIGMNLIQVIEMVCDWMAAAKRSQTGVLKGMEINRKRFGIEPQLINIIAQTIVELQEKEQAK
jgi:hypothetical protein